MLCEPGRIVAGHPPSPRGTAVLPDQKLLPYLFRETGERARLVPAATVPPATPDPGSPASLGRRSGRPPPRRTGWGSLGTGRTCRSSWPGDGRRRRGVRDGRNPGTSLRLSASRVQPWKTGGRAAAAAGGELKRPLYPSLVWSGRSARRVPRHSPRAAGKRQEISSYTQAPGLQPPPTAAGFGRAQSVVHRVEPGGPRGEQAAARGRGAAPGVSSRPGRRLRQRVFGWIDTREGCTPRKAALGVYCAGANCFSLC